MHRIRKPQAHLAHGLNPLALAPLGAGLVYLAALAAFALAFAHPAGIGWIGFGVVATIVLAVTTAVGLFIARSGR
jgi:hypothetical protein